MTDRGQHDVGGILSAMFFCGFFLLLFGAVRAVVYGWEPELAFLGVIGFLLMAGPVATISRLHAKEGSR